jgi:uncharacterized protein YkwD
MASGRLGDFLRKISILGLAPSLIGATGLTTNLNERILAAHNRERASMGVPALTWSPALAASARVWAEHLASTGGFYHSQDRPVNPEGENLWAGSRGYFSAEAMVGAWIREKRYFKPGVFPYNSTTGKVGDIGHYTQLMWRSSTAVGCALVSGRREDVLVCHYSDAGNYYGERPF